MASNMIPKVKAEEEEELVVSQNWLIFAMRLFYCLFIFCAN